MKKKLLQYGICGAIGALLALWVMDMSGFFELWQQPAEAMLILCDAFFVPGILLVMFGALMWIATTGFFDSIAFAFRAAGHLLLPFLHLERKTYYDYKAEKAEKRGSTPYFIFIVGACYLALSVVFLIIWAAL